jgi:glycerate-2-kinase
MVLTSTQPLTEMNTRNLPGVKGGRLARKADKLAAIYERIV